ncbi:cytochrome c class I [Allomuricauda ruestringensis DSM 13258]|uniref:Cytochrome c class I n=1 Tax=Allomuricauda ruestringensis (strain DSM 13258 / CIP 107369 / LMG 19739 / B1) TaxID=886377 RepID=G2PJT9_ALLRU|nr:cytochrome c [Allomuricauda ruestringensis]AEM70894.1 cytochrome c class I [Allomuricauda ruestringensis DSM 13258]
MKQLGKISVALVLAMFAASCADKSSPNYQFMPNMYEPVGYETYQGVDNGLFPDGTEALLPPEGTISRGYMPYEFENTPEGKELARLNTSPLDSLKQEENLAKGAELYAIYCAVCHGSKGDGQGNLVKREKILGVPSYDDVARDITVGTTYHAIYYGLNSMGSYASQFASEEEMWQVSEYVMKLKEDLTK